MARKTFAAAAALMLMLACCSGAHATRGLQQVRTTRPFDPSAPDPSAVTFTFTFNPLVNIDPELGLTAASVAPSLKLGVTPLAVSATNKIGATGTFAPGKSVSGTKAYTAGTTATTVQSADGLPDGNADLLNTILGGMQQGAAVRQQALGQLGGGGLLNALG